MTTALIPFSLVRVKAFTVSPDGDFPQSLVDTKSPDSTASESPDSVELEHPMTQMRLTPSSESDFNRRDFIVPAPFLRKVWILC